MLSLVVETSQDKQDKMVGIEIPAIPVEHQYIVTEPHPEVQKRQKKKNQRWGF